MRKITSIILALLLVLCFVTSCNQYEAGVFKTISETTKQSKITCLLYLGEYGDTHYLVTANKGLVSFEFDGEKATIVDYLAPQFSNDNCCLIEHVIYAEDATGNHFTIDLTEEDTTPEPREGYSKGIITKNGNYIKANGSVVGISNSSATGPENVTKYMNYQETDYFFTSDSVYNGLGKLTLNEVEVSNIVLFCDDYVVVKNDGKYEIHKISAIGTSLAELSAQPKAAYYDESKAYFKTAVGIEIFDGSSVTSVAGDWLNLSITDFVEVGDNLCGIDTSGNMMLLDIAADGSVVATPLFTD